MIRRLRLALPTTLVLLAIELGLSLALARLVAPGLSALTGAGLDPARALPFLSTLRNRDALLAFAPALVVGAAFVLVEPLLSIAFVRAHARPSERGPTRSARRYGALVLLRLAMAVALAVTLAILGGFAFGVDVATRELADPRIHDLALLGLALIAALIVGVACLILEPASALLALGEPRPLEALITAARGLDRGLLLARLATLLPSLALAAWLRVPGQGLGAALRLLALTAARLLLRSAFLAYLVERAARARR